MKVINTEKAFDMLPYAIEIFEKLNIQSFGKKLREKYNGQKNVDQMAVGIEVFLFIAKNSSKVKAEVFNLVAILEGKSAEEVKKQSFATTLSSLKLIFSDEELLSFFKSAMQ
jgi:hypothetical protein